MENQQARSFWVTGPGHGELRDEGLPVLQDGQVLVKTLFSGVSRGTESLVFNGKIPISEYQRMRAPFQGGEFPAPVKYGYSNVGVVETGPDSLVGQSVFCLYPHQSRYIVPSEAVCPLPDGLPPERAILAANMETALNGLWDAAPRLGDRIAVVGAGTVGLLCGCLAARIPGCEVQVVDISAAKTDIADALGLVLVTPDQADSEADLVIHASGAPAGLTTALQLAGFEATVLELSWYGDKPVSVPLGEAFHVKRLQLLSSQVGSVATVQRGRWDYRRRLTKALQLLCDPRLDVLINSESDFEELPQRMADLMNNPGPVLCHRVSYRQ